MLGKRTFKLLSSLTKEEFRRFRKVVQSPFFTSNERHLALYDHLKKYYPAFAHKQLAKEMLFEVCYPKQAFNDRLLRVLLREFTNMIEEYLLILDNRKSDYHKKKTLTQVYGQRNLFEYFEKGTFNLLGELEELEMMDGGQIRDYALLARDYYYHNSTPKFEQIDMLLKAQNKLDEYYILEKLGAYCNYPILERTLKRDLQEPQKLAVLQLANTAQRSTPNSLISLYLLLHELITAGNDATFEQAKTVLENNISILPIEERKFAFFSLLNYSTGQHNKGRIEFYEKSFALNLLGLKHEVYFEHGLMTGTSFINIALNALQVVDFDWVQLFIIENKSKIVLRERESATKLCFGYLYFHYEKYNECIEAISEFESPKVNDILGVKLLLIRSFFSLFIEDNTYLDLFNSSEKSFYKFLKRSNLSHTKKDGFLAFLKFLKQLSTQIKSPDISIAQLSEIENEVSNSPNLVLKKWLLHKIESIKEGL